jgi:hypothetical protein
MLRKCVYLSMALFISTIALAANALPKNFPKGCRPVGFTYEAGKLVLTPVSSSDNIQTVYLIHNNSAHPIKFTAEKIPGQDFVPQYINTIEAEQWSAFSMSNHRLQFMCEAGDGDSNAPTDCAQSIHICQYPRAKFADHNSGTYWLKSAMTLQEMVQAIADDGILLRW